MDTAKALDVLKNESIVNDNWGAYMRSRDNGHLDYVERAQKCNNFYVGEQWEEKTKGELNKTNRPAQTVNLVMSTVNAVLGEQINSRQEITFKPANQDANPETSHALTLVFKQIEANNATRWVETQVCGDGLIEERGYFEVTMDFSDNVFGEVREVALDPRDVLLDPGAKEYDPSTWSDIIVTRWYTPDEIAVLWGEEHADKLRFCDSNSSFGTDSMLFDTETFAQDKSRLFASGEGDAYTYPDEYRRVRRVRVIDRQYRRLAKCKYFVDLVTGDTRKVPGNWNDAQAKDFATRFSLGLREKMERKVHRTITADKELLHDGWNAINAFTVVPFFPYFRRGRPIGLVTNLISPQETLNKVVSQELHVVNTTANSGWIFQSGSLVNLTADQLMQVGAKTGLVLEYARGTEKPEKIQPNQIPSGLDRISDKTGRFFREISGVSDAMLGQPGREISGVALDNKRKGGLTQLEIVFDNLAKTRHMRAKLILAYVQAFYTEQRLVRMTNRNIDGEEETQEIVVNQETPEGNIINDLTLGEYEVVVTSSNLRENDDETTFAQLMQLREQGVMVPDWAILEATNLRNKNELVQYAKQIAGAQEPTEEEIMMQQLVQELEMEARVAATEELKAKAQERYANAQLLIAKAESEGQQIPLALEQLRAQLEIDMQRLAQEAEEARGDLLARLQIADAKSRELIHTGNMQALVARIDTESRERSATITALARSADARVQAMAQARSDRSKERIARLNAAIEAKREQNKLKMNAENNEAKVAVAKAKPKPAAQPAK